MEIYLQLKQHCPLLADLQLATYWFGGVEIRLRNDIVFGKTLPEY